MAKERRKNESRGVRRLKDGNDEDHGHMQAEGSR